MALLSALFLCFQPSPLHAEQLEMDVITVYGKETYRIRKEIFDVLVPVRKEDIQRMKVRKPGAEEVASPGIPRVSGVEVAAYDTTYEIQPTGEAGTVDVIRTGVLLYFIMARPEIQNLHLEFVSADETSRDFYLKRVGRDQYIEAQLAPGRYRLRFAAEGIEPAVVDTLTVRAGQISLAFVPVQEKIAPPPPPPVVAVETAPPPPPETRISVQMVPLRKAVQLPGVRPTMVARGRLKFQEKGLESVQMRLYEKEVGFFDPYDPKVESALLAVTVTDADGNFEFPPIDNDDGVMEGTRDPVLVLELENRHLSVMRALPLTKPIPYRYVLYQKDNVHPDAGNLDVGSIDAKLRKEQPVMIFQAALKKALTLQRQLQILYPEGSRVGFSGRRLQIPSNANISELTQYLDYLIP